jgi:hypothetical protein
LITLKNAPGKYNNHALPGAEDANPVAQPAAIRSGWEATEKNFASSNEAKGRSRLSMGGLGMIRKH